MESIATGSNGGVGGVETMVLTPPAVGAGSRTGGTEFGGFCFENAIRNTMIEEMASKAPAGTVNLPKMFKKTGTTIVGMVYDGGVVLGADTRSTSDSEVAEKNCEKIHYLAPNMYCCGAGTAADTEKITQLISSQMELMRLNTHSAHTRVVTACTLLKRRLFRYQGHISAALILGGCDAVSGPSLYQIHPHGSTAKLHFTTMGSGSLAAMAIMESSWREGMTKDEAVDLVQRSIGAGIFNDLGSGSNCDICIIEMNNPGTDPNTSPDAFPVEYRRNTVQPNPVGPLRDAVNHSAVLQMVPGLTPTIGDAKIVPHPAKVSLADVTIDVTMTTADE